VVELQLRGGLRELADSAVKLATLGRPRGCAGGDGARIAGPAKGWARDKLREGLADDAAVAGEGRAAAGEDHRDWQVGEAREGETVGVRVDVALGRDGETRVGPRIVNDVVGGEEKPVALRE
jgi:hypothetical protein